MGLVASFHGLILAASRATYEFGKTGCIPTVFGRIHPGFKTPVNALLLNMTIGIIALFTGKNGRDHYDRLFWRHYPVHFCNGIGDDPEKKRASAAAAIPRALVPVFPSLRW
jgi:hypothetical protein